MARRIDVNLLRSGFLVKYQDGEGTVEEEYDGSLEEAAVSLAQEKRGTVERIYIAVTSAEMIADFREGEGG